MEDKLRTAYRESELAVEAISAWQLTRSQIGDEESEEGKEAYRRYKDELDRRIAIAEECRQQANKLDKEHSEAFAFSRNLSQGLSQALEILPVGPKFEDFRRAIEPLLLLSPTDWTDPGIGSRVTRLERRLKQLLDLASVASTAEQGVNVSQRAKPRVAKGADERKKDRGIELTPQFARLLEKRKPIGLPWSEVANLLDLDLKTVAKVRRGLGFIDRTTHQRVVSLIETWQKPKRQ
jgi:hypothetical protein